MVAATSASVFSSDRLALCNTDYSLINARDGRFAALQSASLLTCRDSLASIQDHRADPFECVFESVRQEFFLRLSYANCSRFYSTRNRSTHKRSTNSDIGPAALCASSTERTSVGTSRCAAGPFAAGPLASSRLQAPRIAQCSVTSLDRTTRYRKARKTPRPRPGILL